MLTAISLIVIVIIIVAGAVAIGNEFASAEFIGAGGAQSGNVQNDPITTTQTVTASANDSGGEISQVPTVVPIKIDWCNADNSGQDRFCASTIQVVQGDIVQVMFIQNDTDAHTFTV